MIRFSSPLPLKYSKSRFLKTAQFRKAKKVEYVGLFDNVYRVADHLSFTGQSEYPLFVPAFEQTGKKKL